MFRSAAVAVLAIALSSSPAAAQSLWPTTKTLLDAGNKLVQQTSSDADQDGFTVTYAMKVSDDSPNRALYGLHSALQGFDLMTTVAALSAGARETNPLMMGGNRTAMLVAKSATMGFQAYAVQKLERQNPKAARWTMIALNAAMFAVVANNAAVIRH